LREQVQQLVNESECCAEALIRSGCGAVSTVGLCHTDDAAWAFLPRLNPPSQEKAMTFDQQVFAQSVVLYLLWVCGPLVPAVLIYWLFPDTKVSAEGPLSGLTVRAGGAFAAYLVVFFAAYPLSSRQHAILGASMRPFWVLEAEVVANDENGKAITYSNFYNGMTVSLSPDMQVVTGRKVTLKVPMEGLGQRWPMITFQVPNYGGVTIDPSTFSNRMQIDEFTREVKIHGAIPLERFVPTNFGIGPAPAVVQVAP
jgi:hypothetical protein